MIVLEYEFTFTISLYIESIQKPSREIIIGELDLVSKYKLSTITIISNDTYAFIL